MLVANSKIQYHCTLVCGEALGQFDMSYAEVGSTTSENLNKIILGLGAYYLPVNALSKQKCVMRPIMRKLHALKVRGYASCMIYLNKYLSVLPGEKANEKKFVMGFNEIFFNIMPNRWNRQAYIQGFYCETITLKSINMFEGM